MTRDDESNPFQTVLQLLTEEGFDGFASALEILVNEAMKLERTAALHAEPYQRTSERRGRGALRRTARSASSAKNRLVSGSSPGAHCAGMCTL